MKKSLSGLFSCLTATAVLGAPAQQPQPPEPALLASPMSATAPAPPLASADLMALEQGNPFDSNRRLWPDRVPPPPPPAPPPPPPPLTEQDMQLYGVVIVGMDKRATVKVGGRLASSADGGRPFTTLQEGQTVGEYRVARIEPTRLLLQAAGGSQQVYFTKKVDRSSPTMTAAAATPQPVQGAIEAAPAPDAPVPGRAAPAGMPHPPSPSAPQHAGQAATPAAANPPGAPNSLAEALAVARDRAMQSGAQVNGQPAPAPAFGNPFSMMPKP